MGNDNQDRFPATIGRCSSCNVILVDGDSYAMIARSQLVYGRIGDPSPYPTGRTKPVREYRCRLCLQCLGPLT